MTATATPSNGASPVASDHDDRLEVEASRLRPRRALPFDRMLQLAGAVLPLLGLLAIVVAWYGVSHTARTWRQTPYVVSGGLLGLGLIFLGGFSYFAYWLTVLVHESRRQTEVLDRIAASLGAAPAVANEGLVVDAGQVVHRPDCPLLVARDETEPLRPGSGRVTACPVCAPELPATSRRRRS